MREKTIGILGGMGPEATIDLFTKIVKGTRAKKDQDHLRIIIENNPKIPDRTLAIQGRGPSPLPQLIRSAKILEKAGADFIVIPCVTVHHFFESFKGKIKIPILHIIEETVRYVERKLKRIKRIGLLATSGTVESGIFQKAFSHHHVELILPDQESQKKLIMEAIYGREGIKAIGPSERSKALLLRASHRLVRNGAQAILAGCTEIPLVLKDGDLPVPVIDPLSILAESAIKRAGGRKALRPEPH